MEFFYGPPAVRARMQRGLVYDFFFTFATCLILCASVRLFCNGTFDTFDQVFNYNYKEVTLPSCVFLLNELKSSFFLLRSFLLLILQCRCYMFRN